MNIISRDFLHQQLSITVEYTNKSQITYSRRILNEYIDRAKTYLVVEKHVKQGEKILLEFDAWPDFLVWFMAAAELGLILTVLDPASKSVPDILKIYGGINHVISNDTGYIIPTIFYEYVNTSQKDLILARDDFPLVYTTSSGSTNTPTLVTYTHDFLYKLAKRNSNVYNLNETDKCLHVHTLIHSSIVGIYFLPVLHSCTDHYYFDVEEENWVALVQREKINRCAIFHKYLTLIEKHFDTDVDYDFNIIAISQLSNQLKQKLNNYVRILSAFGCSEVSGPVLLSTIGEVDTLENNFGKPLDDFYNIYIEDGELTIEFEKKKINTGDRFCIDKGDFIYQGRLNLYKINNAVVDIGELLEFIEEVYQIKCDIVVDLKYNLIYARLDIEINLELLNQHILKEFDQNYQISSVVFSPRDEFINNVKFNANGVRIACRQKLLLEPL